MCNPNPNNSCGPDCQCENCAWVEPMDFGDILDKHNAAQDALCAEAEDQIRADEPQTWEEYYDQNDW